MSPAYPPLSRAEIETLARFNAEKARGVEHTLTWKVQMKSLQERFDAAAWRHGG